MCVCEVASVMSDSFCDPMDCSLPGSSVCRILQARILEWVAMLSSRGSSRPRDQTHISSGSYMAGGFFLTEPLGKPLNVAVPKFLAPGISLIEDNFSMDWGRGMVSG